jgi:tRNA threonylcarbamoyl adenosine modification protein YeaZ
VDNFSRRAAELFPEKFRNFSVNKSAKIPLTILAVDATGDVLTVALVRDNRLFKARRSGRDSDEALLPAVDAVMKKAGVSWKDLDAVAVASGPGRFTGIRVGMSFATMLAFKLEIPALALSRLEAAAAKSEAREVVAALPGWKGEVYHQLFRRGRSVGKASWTAPEAWDAAKRAAENKGVPVLYGETDASDLLPVARRRLAERRIPPFEPFYLKPAGYERRR